MGLTGGRRLRTRRVIVLAVILIIVASSFHASQYGRLPEKYGFIVHGRPLLNYTSMGFQEESMIRDVWNESFEVPLNNTNHYWYGGGVIATDDAVKRNNTLDPGFEEVSSSSLNPYVNLPSWFLYRNTTDVTVKARRSGNVSYSGSYSAYVETRYVNTTAFGYVWQTPVAINGSCSSGAGDTIDENTATEWTHVTSELHWVIYDLGQGYIVRKVRVYCGSERIEDVDIYVSSSTTDFGSAVVELWDPPNNNGWSESPFFYKEGRYIKLVFGTTVALDKLTGAFYEFDAHVRTSGRGHVAGGLRVPQDYFVKMPCVYLSDNPSLTSVIFLSEAGTGSGACDAYYLWVEVEIQNGTSALRIVYVAPVTTLGSPSPDHFTNTTATKYIYNVTTVHGYEVWMSFTRNVTRDYESIWGQVYNATVMGLAVRNDFFNPATDSETNTPFIKANYDAVSLKLASHGDEEEIVNGGFEAPGWVKVQENKLDAFNYTKDASDSKEGTTSFFMNVTGDTSGSSGSGFSATKHGVVGIDSSSFVRESNDTYVQRLRGFIKVENMSGVVNQTEYSYVAVRVKFQQLSQPYDTYQLFYCVMLYGSLPSSNSSQKYVELVKFDKLQTGVWYELSRRPMVDGGWKNVKITEIALVIAFYYGTRSSTDKANAVARFDYIRLIKEEPTGVYTRQSKRSTNYVLDENYSLRQNASLGELEYDVYETGAENANNTFYVAFPRHVNFSTHYYVASYQANATIQVSLAIDDGPRYGGGYLYELIYYYGSPSGVDCIFLSGPTQVVEVSPSITTQTWVRFVRNWTLDLPSTWTIVYPRVEAVGLKIWTSGTLLDVYWDLAAFYGVWYGVKKTAELQSVNEIYARKFNFTDDWGFVGGLDPGIDDFVDNNVSNVDSSPGRGSHGNFTNEQLGPDLLYDALTEDYVDSYLTNTEDYVDNNSSDVDSYPGRGTHGNFTAMRYGPDSINDTLTEEYMGLGTDVEDYVDNNSSDVDSSPNKGSHTNFTAMRYGPDSINDTLTEQNTNPPPNNVEDYVDNNSSDVDSSPNKGSHTNFTAIQYGPDSIYDTLTEQYTGTYGVDIEDYVDNNSSDVDASPNKGSHSNFTAMQYGPDSIYDTLTEENTGKGTGTWTNPTSVYSKCGEEGGYSATKTIDDDTTTDWRHLVTERHWVVYDMGQSMIISKVRIYTGAKPTEYTVEDVNVYVSEDATFDESERMVTDWDVPKGGWAESPSFSKRGRYIKLDNMSCTQPGGQLKFAFFEFDAWTVRNYELDLEVQWINVNYNQTNEKLCIYCGAMGAEDLRVDVWNGSAWVNLLTDLYPGWNNVSVAAYLTNSTFIIRFKGGTETGDEVQESWKIDATLLHVWTPPDPNYELDLEVQWTSVDYGEVNEELCIRTGNLGSEDVRVDYWTGSAWVTLFTDLTANSWNNITVSLTSPTFTIRFRGGTELNDTVQDSWQIDAALLHVWTEGPNYQLDLEVQWTSVDYGEVNEELCIYAGSLGAEDLRVDVWSGSAWNNLLTDLNPGWNNVSVAAYLKSSEFTIRFKGANETDDETQESWQIDAALLHVWTEGPNYQLDLEVQWTNVNYTQENEVLCIYAGSLGSENIMVECWTGVGWHTLLSDLAANSWNNVSVSTYLTSPTFTIRFRGGTELNDTVQDSWQIDAALLHVWTEGGYQLDLEVQWTNADYDEKNKILCIYAGSLGSENIMVECWTGVGWHTLLSDLAANSWNNVSVSTYLTSPTFTIRFRGGYDVSGDTVQDSWQIDAALLHVWTFVGYQLDLEVQFTDVNNYERSGELCIYTGALGSESLRVDYWTGSAWSNLIPGLGAKRWNNVSVPLSSTVTIRFKGGTETEDTVQDSWQIDAAVLHVWLAQIGSSARANATSANGWYYKWWDIRKIYAKNATGSYEITANSTSQGILSFYDNDWNPEDNATTYDDSTGYVKYNVTDFKLTAYGKNLEYQDYVIVEYIILFSGPSGAFRFSNNSTATAACDADEYGQEFWLVDKQGSSYRDYVTSNSTRIITY